MQLNMRQVLTYRSECMAKWDIADNEIEEVERLLLNKDCHFANDARQVIRCWDSAEVAACPGSGKTTVLLAKLKLLADRMPLEGGAGICVLSHTNVAVNEIKTVLADYADKILGYPNFVGTIQSFIDRYVVLLYLRKKAGRTVQPVDNETYAKHMLQRLTASDRFATLAFFVRNQLRFSQYPDMISIIQALSLRDDGALCIGETKRLIAGSDKPSAEQYKALVEEMQSKEGLIRYDDAYYFAEKAIDDFKELLTDLFAKRFQYVFIDEYQDCSDLQRRVLEKIFNPAKCNILHIGDVDQAIYNNMEDKTPDWIPNEGFLPIMASCRFNQEIADFLSSLKNDGDKITAIAGNSGIKPVLLVFSLENIDRVLDGYIKALDRHGLYDPKGKYTAIGAIRKPDATGLKIGDYWSGFDGRVNNKNEYNYWSLIDEISGLLKEGKLYRAEQGIRKQLCRLFHYLNIKDLITGKEYTLTTLKNELYDNYDKVYRQKIYELTLLPNYDRKSIDSVVRQLVVALVDNSKITEEDIFSHLPKHFLNKITITEQQRKTPEDNVYTDFRGRRIVFTTIHAVKGQTHEATLYLETERNRSTDLRRLFPFLGIDRAKITHLHNYSRKLAYVGMSRPKKLLCVAMQSETYERSKGFFDDGKWEVVDLR